MFTLTLLRWLLPGVGVLAPPRSMLPRRFSRDFAAPRERVRSRAKLDRLGECGKPACSGVPGVLRVAVGGIWSLARGAGRCRG